MPAPTALQRRPEEVVEAVSAAPEPQERSNGKFTDDFDPSNLQSQVANKQVALASGSIDDDNNDASMVVDEEGRPKFAPDQLTKEKMIQESRKVPIPPHRMTPLKNEWPKIYPPLVEHLELQVRMNTKSRSVELRNSKFTKDPGALQKGEDFVHAFALGFEVDDAIALLRLDDLYIETFEIRDVKSLQGEHLSRAIGRIAGKDGKMKFSIENASRTRIVLADQKIHILGGFQAIHVAREAIVSLILGSPPGKVYGNLRTVASRMKQRF